MSKHAAIVTLSFGVYANKLPEVKDVLLTLGINTYSVDDGQAPRYKTLRVESSLIPLLLQELLDQKAIPFVIYYDALIKCTQALGAWLGVSTSDSLSLLLAEVTGIPKSEIGSFDKSKLQFIYSAHAQAHEAVKKLRKQSQRSLGYHLQKNRHRFLLLTGVSSDDLYNILELFLEKGYAFDALPSTYQSWDIYVPQELRFVMLRAVSELKIELQRDTDYVRVGSTARPHGTCFTPKAAGLICSLIAKDVSAKKAEACSNLLRLAGIDHWLQNHDDKVRVKKNVFQRWSGDHTVSMTSHRFAQPSKPHHCNIYVLPEEVKRSYQVLRSGSYLGVPKKDLKAEQQVLEHSNLFELAPALERLELEAIPYALQPHRKTRRFRLSVSKKHWQKADTIVQEELPLSKVPTEGMQLKIPVDKLKPLNVPKGTRIKEVLSPVLTTHGIDHVVIEDLSWYNWRKSSQTELYLHEADYELAVTILSGREPAPEPDATADQKHKTEPEQGATLDAETQHELKSLIGYFHSCFEADNRELSLNSIFATKVSHLMVVEQDAEWLTGDLVHLPVKEDWAEKVETELTLYRREKELLLGVFPVVGKSISSNGRSTTICSPLIFLPLTLDRNDDADNAYPHLEIDYRNGRLNYALLTLLARETDADLNGKDDIIRKLPHGKIGFGEAGKISRLLKRLLPEVDTELLLMFPDLWNTKKLKRRLQPAQMAKHDGFQVLPVAAAFVVQRSNRTEGSLAELKSLANSNQISSPIHHLFKEVEEQPDTPVHITPATILNESQRQALQLPEKFPLSLIVGPPGTGKSYTLSCLAANSVAQGKSILIASRNDEAVDVIAHKLKENFGMEALMFRVGHRDQFDQMEAQANQYWQRIKAYREMNLKLEIADLKKEIARRKRKTKELHSSFKSLTDLEIDWSRFIVKKQAYSGFLKNIRKKFERHAPQNANRLWKIVLKLEKLADQNRADGLRLNDLLYWQRNLDEGWARRNTIAKYVKAVRSRNSDTQYKRFKSINWQHLLETRPVWLVKLNDLAKVLPLRSHLFDTVVIDEASQCDVASALPLLQRGKRGVLCGDPLQLRHVSFLSRARQLTLTQKHQLNPEDYDFLDYRSLSVLDVFQITQGMSEQSVFLDEHFRSMPDIIGFSNRHIYQKRLKVMTDRPASVAMDSNELVMVEGSRDASGVNDQEIAAILDRITAIVEEESERPDQDCTSIGILSPFRKQTDAINHLLGQRFKLAQIRRHRLMAGTAFSFQGEERDVMMLSFVIDSNSSGTSKVHLNKPDVFNVSVTRARQKQIVFCSIPPADLKPDHLLRKFLEYMAAPREEDEHLSVYHNAFANDVVNALNYIGFSCVVDFPIAGQSVDIIVRHGKKMMGIDLIGYPGKFESAFTVERYLLLKRAGLQTFPLPFTYWLISQELCLEEIIKFMKK